MQMYKQKRLGFARIACYLICHFVVCSSSSLLALHTSGILTCFAFLCHFAEALRLLPSSAHLRFDRISFRFIALLSVCCYRKYMLWYVSMYMHKNCLISSCKLHVSNFDFSRCHLREFSLHQKIHTHIHAYLSAVTCYMWFLMCQSLNMDTAKKIKCKFNASKSVYVNLPTTTTTTARGDSHLLACLGVEDVNFLL